MLRVSRSSVERATCQIIPDGHACDSNLQQGGWIEQVEPDVVFTSDDGSLPEDSFMRTWGPNTMSAAEKTGRRIDITNTMRAGIEKAGFIDVHEKVYKIPIGTWPKDPLLKEVGRLGYHHALSGMEGWGMWLLTNHGVPKPWTKQDVQVYVAKLQAEIKTPQYHSYHIL